MPFLQALFALAIALLVSAGVIAAAGADPLAAFAALAAGAFGSVDSLSEVGVKTCPLLLAGLGVALAFRAGLWNIGAEGQLLAGGIVMAWVGVHPPPLPAFLGVPLALLLAAGAGAAWAAVPAVLKLRRGVSEVIGTIMLNFIALGLVGYLVQGPLMEAAGRYPQSDPVDAALRLPRLAAGARVHAGLVLGVALAAGAELLLFRTPLGYAMRAVGLNPTAARLAGLPVTRAAFTAFALSGALAGLAGGVEVSAVTFRLYERFSPGYGFSAIAVALLGRLHPLGVLVSAFLFGALEAGSNAMQRAADISAVLVAVIQATIILALLAADRLPRSTLATVPRNFPSLEKGGPGGLDDGSGAQIPRNPPLSQRENTGAE
jgi:simple sugar transport system permease protein